MATFNSRTRQDTDPYVIWSSKEVNEELNNISTRASSLSANLLNLSTAQAVEGQKTFLNLYFLNQTPTYETALEIYQNDISPVFTTGAKAISSVCPQELATEHPNVSGEISSMALRNPIFRKGSSVIYNSGNTIYIDIKNIPFASYDAYKVGTKPNTNGTTVGAFYWATSQPVFTDLELINAIGGVVAGARYEIIACFKDSEGIVDCFIVREGYSSSISNDYKSFRRIGFFRLDGSSNIIPFKQVDDTYYLFTYQKLSDLSKFIQDTCIVKAKLNSATAFNPVYFNGNLLHVLEGTGAAAVDFGYGNANQDFYLTMIWNAGSFPEFTPEDSLYFNTILFGALF